MGANQGLPRLGLVTFVRAAPEVRLSAVLERAGNNPDEIRAILQAKYEKAALANARQEDMKRASKAQTEETVALTDDLYRTASGYLDAAIAAAGKGSEAAKNFQRLRSRVRMPDGIRGSVRQGVLAVRPVIDEDHPRQDIAPQEGDEPRAAEGGARHGTEVNAEAERGEENPDGVQIQLLRSSGSPYVRETDGRHAEVCNRALVDCTDGRPGVD